MELLDNLKWRYATKRMNGNMVPEETLDNILDAARYAPSSSGLQPYQIFVIQQGKTLENINNYVFEEFPFNQNQIADCSHLLVWASWDQYTSERVGNVLEQIAKSRNISADSSSDYKNRLLTKYSTMGKSWQTNHCIQQAFISFGIAIAAAAEKRVDATPMEGFDPVKMDEFLNLKSLGLKSVVALPIGYREAEKDWNVSLAKWRTPEKEFIKKIR